MEINRGSEFPAARGPSPGLPSRRSSRPPAACSASRGRHAEYVVVPIVNGPKSAYNGSTQPTVGGPRGRAVAELKGRGVRFADYDYPGLKTVEHVCVLGSEKAAWFEDTEGNILCLHEDIA